MNKRNRRGKVALTLVTLAIRHSRLYPWQVDAIERLHDKIVVLDFKSGIGKARCQA